MKIDVTVYRERYLKEVEERIMAKKERVPNFTTQNLHEAIMSELNRADETTWEVEIPDDRERALNEAEKRIIEHMRENVDLGVGMSY